MTDPALTAEQEEQEFAIEREVERRLEQRLAQAETERRLQDKEAGVATPITAAAAALGDLYPPRPSNEDTTQRTFPRGTTVSEVIEYDRLQAEERLAARGLTRPEPPLPEGTVSATAAEFLAQAAGGRR